MEWVDRDKVADAVRRAADGDPAAWDAIVESFTALIWAVALGHRLSSADAAEVVQSTWLKLLSNLSRIREPDRLGGWLATTARREALHLLQQRSREIPTDDELRLDRGPNGPTPEDEVLERDRDARLWQAFRRLSERCRTLLHLVIVVGPSYAEVAAATVWPLKLPGIQLNEVYWPPPFVALRLAVLLLLPPTPVLVPPAHTNDTSLVTLIAGGAV